MKHITALRTLTSIGLALLLFLTTVTAIAEESNNTVTIDPLETEVIEVTDAVSFLAAIGPNRTIRLLPGDYDLSSDAVMEIMQTDGPTQYPYLSYDLDYYSGIVISDIYNMTIIADSPQEIYTQNINDTVLIFNECSYVTVSGITLGHKPETSSRCSAGVITTSYCNHITFDRCDLYGCGYQAAEILLSSSVLFEDCIIRDCSELAAYMESVRNIAFVRCDIYGNGTECSYPSGLFWITGESKNIVFDECDIHKNGNAYTESTTMFRVDWVESELTIMDCEMDNNLYDEYIFEE